MPPQDDAIWVPVTLHLPLGFTKNFTPRVCTPYALIVGPFTIIFLAQLANTVLVPVLPFLVKDVGASAVAYGSLQSAMWTSQTFLSPVHGWLSDRIGRRPVIVLTLLVSSGGCALLAVSHSVTMMFVARVISGLGFQIALFRAYFADTAPKEKRAGSFGLVGVVQSFSLFAGPTIGGIVAHAGGRRASAWLAGALNLGGAILAMLWQPDEPRKGESDRKSLQREQSTVGMSEAQIAEHRQTHQTVNGVKMVKISLSDAKESYPVDVTNTPATSSQEPTSGICAGSLCRCFRTTFLFMKWLAGYDLYPLLSLNFFFRFAFAAYKSIFAFYCMTKLGYGTKEVGYALSAMGLGGMAVQGVLVRVTVHHLGEEQTLVLAMAATSAGFGLLSYATDVLLLAPALTLIAIGYGLAVPCLSALFAQVPVEQGIMQGIAGAIDRFGQAFGPIAGGAMLAVLGESGLMRVTGIGLAAVSTVCLGFIGEGTIFRHLRACFCSGREAPYYVKMTRQQEYEEIEIVDLFLCCCCDEGGRPGYRPISTKDLDVTDEGDLGPAIKPKSATVNPA